jgi:hypothetical protein
VGYRSGRGTQTDEKQNIEFGIDRILSELEGILEEVLTGNTLPDLPQVLSSYLDRLSSVLSPKGCPSSSSKPCAAYEPTIAKSDRVGRLVKVKSSFHLNRPAKNVLVSNKK